MCTCLRVYVCKCLYVCVSVRVVLFQLETEHSDKLARWKVDAQSKLEDAENAAAMAKFQSYEQVQILQSTAEKVFGFLARIKLLHCNSSITCLHCECHAHLLVPAARTRLGRQSGRGLYAIANAHPHPGGK